MNPNASRDLARIDRIMLEIYFSQTKPGWKRQTSTQLKFQADRKREMADHVRANGGQVKPAYAHIDMSEEL